MTRLSNDNHGGGDGGGDEYPGHIFQISHARGLWSVPQPSHIRYAERLCAPTASCNQTFRFPRARTLAGKDGADLVEWVTRGREYLI